MLGLFLRSESRNDVQIGCFFAAFGCGRDRNEEHGVGSSVVGDKVAKALGEASDFFGVACLPEMAVAASRGLGVLCNFADVGVEGVTVHGKWKRMLLEKVGGSFRLAALGMGAMSVVILGAGFLAAGRLSTLASFWSGAVVKRDWRCKWNGIDRCSWNGVERHIGSGGCMDGGLEKGRAIVMCDVGARRRHAWRHSCWLDRSR
jgi:hypothetical protein